ncbi:SIS domain-containing protein [Breznakiella homolactica]|uniref:Glutamine--fructose-6-phosphate aminotransferase [isomerizing] n=1 Tax=Breznakiella homolactica TaxID=2798577 RepID=A0A7T7XLL3_9SPIR|nr:SIS domain-containing protein [Breznakiella homolactica]QQO08458.1 SIS domain-containing protein [Breznakiella homolactica]
MEFDNPLRRQVFSLPDLIREQYKDLEPKIRETLSTPEIYSIQRIVLTGCGDSYAAVYGMRYAFEELTGIRTEVVQTIELSRHYNKKYLGYAPNNPLVIAVSNSGKVARLGEAIDRVNKYGAFSLGITGDPESPVGTKSKRIVRMEIPKFESAPGTRTYLVSLLALLLIAIRIGEVKGKFTMDTAKAYRKDILAQADALEDTLPAMDTEALKTAKTWKDFPAFDFIGSGMDYATAWFGTAKVFEATGAFAASVNTEEWLHLNFFMRDNERIGTVVVISKDNPALSRAKEVIAYARELGRPLMVITDGDEADFNVPAVYCKVPKTELSFCGLLTQFTPLCLLMGYIQIMIGERSGRGCEGPWSFSKGAACVRSSEIIIL